MPIPIEPVRPATKGLRKARSGTGKCLLEFGTQGGRFESWFRINPDNPAVGGRVPVNSATLEELTRLPGVTERIAGDIITRRESEPFGALEELRQVRGVGEAMLKKIRDLVHFD